MQTMTSEELRQNAVDEVLIASRDATNEAIRAGTTRIVPYGEPQRGTAKRAFISNPNGYYDLFILDTDDGIHKFTQIELLPQS